MNIGFIDVDTIKNNSIIDQNIDDKLIEFVNPLIEFSRR
jgi:hypothetical protein